MWHYRKYAYLLVRLLSILVMNELIDELPHMADFEMLRMALLQAYVASAGLIVVRPHLRYCSSAFKKLNAMLRLSQLYRMTVSLKFSTPSATANA